MSKQIGMFKPKSEWVPPMDFPNIKDADKIAIDLETKDPDLKTKGSGAIIGHGEIIGIAVAVDGWSGYYPIAHREGNLDKRLVLEWFKEVCEMILLKYFIMLCMTCVGLKQQELK